MPNAWSVLLWSPELGRSFTASQNRGVINFLGLAAIIGELAAASRLATKTNWRRPVQRAFLHLVRRSISWKLRKRQEGRSRHVKCSWRARLIERKRCWSTVSVGVNSGAFVGLQWKHEKCSPRV